MNSMYISYSIIVVPSKYKPYHRLYVQIFDIQQIGFDILNWVKGMVNTFDSEKYRTVYL